jgi:hypothetical protein
MTDTPQQSPQTLREALVAKSTWFRFHQGTGEFTGEYCSVRPHDAAGMVPMVSVETALALAERPAIEREAHSVESISRAIDPGAWEHELPGMTRAAVEGFHLRHQQANAAAERVVALLPARSEPVVDGAAEVLEHAAKVAECAFDDRPRSRVGHPSHIDWEDGYREGTQAAAAAIRALQPADTK